MNDKDTLNRNSSRGELSQLLRSQKIIAIAFFLILTILGCIITDIFSDPPEDDLLWRGNSKTNTVMEATHRSFIKTEDAKETQNWRATQTTFWAQSDIVLTQKALEVKQTELAYEQQIAQRQKNVHETETQIAIDRSKTETQKAIGFPPVINLIKFPSEIPGNKSTIMGSIYFLDSSIKCNRLF